MGMLQEDVEQLQEREVATTALLERIDTWTFEDAGSIGAIIKEARDKGVDEVTLTNVQKELEGRLEKEQAAKALEDLQEALTSTLEEPFENVLQKVRATMDAAVIARVDAPRIALFNMYLKQVEAAVALKAALRQPDADEVQNALERLQPSSEGMQSKELCDLKAKAE